MLRYLLDTSTLSWVIAPKPSDGVIRRLSRHEGECAIAALVWHELRYGCERLPSGRRKTEIEVFLRNVVHVAFPILPYDEAAAAWHGSERARQERIGKPAPFVDGQIAAVARVNELVLVTANPKDFRGFDDLDVEDWR
jgi:tRNA(fMet)-specific endonuclease VapC